jgi:hypothetical protein
MVRRMLGSQVCHGRTGNCSRPGERGAQPGGVRGWSTAVSPVRPARCRAYPKRPNPTRATSPIRHRRAATRPIRRSPHWTRCRWEGHRRQAVPAACTRPVVSTRWVGGVTQERQAHRRPIGACTESPRRPAPQPPKPGQDRPGPSVAPVATDGRCRTPHGAASGGGRAPSVPAVGRRGKPLPATGQARGPLLAPFGPGRRTPSVPAHGRARPPLVAAVGPGWARSIPAAGGG